ncbi:hypothetical protein N665_0172s0109 [Sinapis alba]|nr:hypothetical protein N665_0172s0109 [Sinapis alba]
MNSSFVFVLTIVLFVGLNEAVCHKNTLAFQNNLAQSHSTLEVHCKSRDNDLGVHLVKFNDPAYTVRFNDNVFIRTRWDCVLRQGPKMEYSQSFRAYNGGVIRKCNERDTWISKDDGIYLSTNGKPEEKKLDWTKK